ncbi:efflux RND transporter periplasmic adaptor subunit [Thiobacillus sp.]|uniref:efflux RND transporter periplasmic adaptor subunit n=1 Tax=Thiobacillus sp. TaxID=924 RepID=UPI0011D77E63|nr:efflux RND transporter periplasmic adaptor subunit [Thiobacillus sp.]MBC2730671.1 efflux RND transporter periplasmic adaptor subunit [Thiobacillus sp.]MBC2739408.1 efflux RND transporter periplasmic adaptor subunit [Thiobacillus sp.]MBC2760308.1 efflux RND transporter periplasmic adaptor subunit [Thiobacillus sp.]TXH75281.1 MAG: efflux RND transporter periplasmic adaptor subunit [Thiobacillus sp.]
MNQRMAAIALAGLSLLGTHPLWAADKVELTTRVSGVVESVLVKPGQRVKKGAVLLRLDRTILQARLEEATADHARAQADEADAKREQGRAQELYDRTVSSTSELEAAELRYARAQAALSAAQARRVIAQKNLADAELKAPFDGLVSAIPGGAGTVVVADCQPKPLIVLSR